MMKKLILSAAVVLGMTATTAMAADVSMPTSYDWTGLYAGVVGGYAFGGNDVVGFTDVTSGGFGFKQFDKLGLSGGFGGLDAGYNWQEKSILFGIEGDIEGGSIKGSYAKDLTEPDSGFSSDASNRSDFFGTLRGRLGLPVDRALFYVTGGAALANVKYNAFLTDGTDSVDIKSNTGRFGYVVGAGVEYAFDDKWSMKLEYQYLNFGSTTLKALAAKSGDTISTKETPRFHTVRLGVNFKF